MDMKNIRDLKETPLSAEWMKREDILKTAARRTVIGSNQVSI